MMYTYYSLYLVEFCRVMRYYCCIALDICIDASVWLAGEFYSLPFSESSNKD